MTKNSFGLRSASAAAIIGLTLTLGAPAAFATVGSDANNATSGLSTIDSSKKGTLTIHKQGLTNDQIPNPEGSQTGEVDNTAPGTALDGATFTLYDIYIGNDKINLTTNAGLAQAAKLSKAGWVKKGDNYELVADGVTYTAKPSTQGAKTTGKDGQAGQAQWDGIDLGAYLVVETATPTGYVQSGPFVAFVPMTKANNGTNAGTSWNYDVHAYPKNTSKNKPVKEVKDAGQNTGGTYAYDIKTTVRNVTDGKKLAYYWIEDTLDAKNLDVENAFKNITVTVNDVEVSGGEEEREGIDYVLQKDTATGNFVIRFTNQGLTKLKSNANVVVHVVAPKKTDGEVVPNEAREYEPSNPSTDQGLTEEPKNPGPNETYLETTPVFTYSSGIEFKKVDKAGGALEGAEFKVFQTAAGTKTCDGFNSKSEGAIDLNGPEAGGDIFTSGTNGLVTITGLHVNDFADNKEVPEVEQSVYCLVETKAPKGKELLAQPIQFSLVWDRASTQKVTRTTQKQTFTTDALGNTTVKTENVNKTYDARDYKFPVIKVGNTDNQVLNLDDTTPQLPLTGGTGIGLLAAIGAALVGAGAWFARRNSKKA